MNQKIILYIILFSLFGCNSNMNKKMATLEYKTKAILGEGAIWNYKTQELYWIDIEGKQLNIYHPKTNTNSAITTQSRIGTVVPFTENGTLVALEDGVYKINLTSGESTLFVNMESELLNSRLNDGKCDPTGRLWVGSMHLDQLPKKANLYTIVSENKLENKIDSVTISNGIVWTSDKKTMYYIDTPTSTIKAYDYEDSTGKISNEKIVIQIPKSLGYPDGMTIDEENMLWVCMWSGNAVIRFNPKTGEIISKVEVPAHNVTSCAFGGENLDELYITTASIDMTAAEIDKYPLAGSIFKIKPGVKGVMCNFYKEN